MASPTALTRDAARILETPEYRIEGPLKVTGYARYTGDVRLPGMLYARFLMSPFPHARIGSIDTSAARAVPGVHAVLTGRDIGTRRFGRLLFDWPVLAWDRVLFIGERVAAVAAETREAAEEATRLIRVEYEELPAVLDVDVALEAGAPVLHPDASGYVYLFGARPPRPHPNLQGYELIAKGDEIERAFERADRIFEDVYTGPRQHQGYIEPHACVVWIARDGTVRVYSTNKSPFALRQQLSIVTGLAQERIVVDSMHIGGDFGGKGHSIDEFACYYLAQATGRPIKSVMTYSDELGAANPRHEAKFYLKTGVTRDGRILAHQSRAHFNGGAYGAAKPMPNLMVPAGPWALDVYNVPNTRLETFVVYTNTVPCGHMRNPGAACASLAGEGHIEHIARALGIDPLEFRLLNAVRDGDTNGANERMRNPRAVEVLEALRQEANWAQRSTPPLPNPPPSREAGRPDWVGTQGGRELPKRGRGIALRRSHIGQGKTEVVLRLADDGVIEALYGTPDQGSGSATVVRRIAAAVLSIDPERIVVRYGDTREAPPDPGSGASRVTHIVGRATLDAATELRQKLVELAAEVMGWHAGHVRLEQDWFIAEGNADQRAPFDHVSRHILRGGSVEAHGGYQSTVHQEEGGDYNFYAYMVDVEVDPATGQITPLEAVMAVDVGTIINPVAHQGQLEGAFVYGLGNTLMEELVVEDGRVTTLSLGDYKLPTQMDVPPLRTVLVPTDVGPGPFGAKGAGEITNAGVTPAFANAVYDAVGVRLRTFPVTADRVWRALQERDAAV